MIGVLLACSLALPSLKIDVEGDGYLRFVRDGRIVYAKSATLTLSEGVLVSEAGHPVAPTIMVSGQPTKLEIDLEGRVRAAYSAGPKEVGRLVLALFKGTAPAAGSGGFLVSSEKPTLVNPGEGATGVIRMSGPATPSKSLGTPKTTTKPVDAPKSDAARIDVRAVSEVSGRQFTLGEIAEIQGNEALAAIVMGESPALGIERGIDKTRIVSRLKMAGVDTAKLDIRVPSNAKVVRKGQKIEHERFLQTATEAAKALVPDSGDWVSTSNQGAMTVPEGEVELTAERSTRKGAQVSITVGVVVDGKRFNSRTLTLTAGPGTKAVRSGAAVRVRVISNGAVVEVAGRTKGPASVGASVEVVTNASPQMPSTTLSGKLVSESLVEVRL
ncbi:MAG TPA: hypothetical protein PLL78_06100 [Fimbriimonadaceae bacterium]|nr:hypothetical protein [Fimbriimonadaceae bacterium]HRJ96239.1 hypothetical protein [Fimbriimonadaceae bacterium]